MILYQDNTPIPVTVKSVNIFGYVRLYHKFTAKFVALLPARFVREQNPKAQIMYNGHLYRWMDYKGAIVYKDDTYYVIGPHHYAFYLDSKNQWRESASYTNEQLKIDASNNNNKKSKEYI